MDGHVFEDPLAPDDDIRPTTMQPIVRENRDTGQRDLVLARWGFIPPWQKPGEKPPPTTFNARSEGVEKAAMWKRAFARHRCLVPADAFFEWQKLRPRNNPKFAFTVDGLTPFAFAGLWSAWKDPANGQWLQSFTVLTTDANETMQPVHNRMPIILKPKDFARWLSRDETSQLPLDLLRPLSDGLQCKPVENEPGVASKRLAQNNIPAEAPDADQPGLFGDSL
ncbi:Putative SOS response-associated peptidase YedK [Terriglobus roseus]|uniref:Abasic site processing protein n=1 Tax=Terriglobus roseus TaxID=392734 RepID=A0A1H4MTE3_9BACT|nr:Putative SOS response-associated peptidase YedK [Terriglobus roseus]